VLDALVDRFSGDALITAVSRMAEQYAAPFFERVRADLLSRVSGEPPATFRDRLIESGFPAIDEPTANILWKALVRAAADIPPGGPTS